MMREIDFSSKLRYLLFIFLFTSFVLNAQETFNLRETFGYVACRPGSVLPIEDGYLISGVVADTSSAYSGLMLAKINLEGDIVFNQTHFIENENLECFRGTLVEHNDSTLWLSGYMGSGANGRRGLGLKLNKAGDLLDTFSYHSPYSPEYEVLTPLDMKVENSNKFSFINAVYSEEGSNHTYFNAVDTTGVLLLENTISFPFDNAHVSNSTFVKKDNHYYLFMHKWNIGFDTDYYQGHFVKLDTFGNTVLTKSYPSQPTAGVYFKVGYASMVTSDGNILVAGGKGVLFGGGTGAVGGAMKFIKVMYRPKITLQLKR